MCTSNSFGVGFLLIQRIKCSRYACIFIKLTNDQTKMQMSQYHFLLLLMLPPLLNAMGNDPERSIYTIITCFDKDKHAYCIIWDRVVNICEFPPVSFAFFLDT